MVIWGNLEKPPTISCFLCRFITHINVLYATVCFLGLLEISPVERGVVTLFGVRSGLFVAMNSKGKLYGSVSIYIKRYIRLIHITNRQTVHDFQIICYSTRPTATFNPFFYHSSNNLASVTACNQHFLL